MGSIPIARSTLGVVQVPRPPATGDAYVVKQLREILFSEPILGAAAVRPKGYLKGLALNLLFGWAGPMLARRATEPLPPTLLYLAVTPVDVRLFAKPLIGDAFEIGRWKKSAYRASAVGDRLDMLLTRLGRVTMFGDRAARPVIDLVVQGAAGPAAPA
ncbi:MAG TPA: hypothetical protein VJR46_08245 [Candidatus Dormibacteraeota bacterium]|nr:hypothetical protein [Candidatus Dormibacteraeota bacterium]